MDSSHLRRDFGHYLREKRVQAGLSQGDVATALGYGSPQFVSNWERGLCGIPMRRLRQLIDLYGLKPEQVTEKLLFLQRRFLEDQLATPSRPRRGGSSFYHRASLSPHDPSR